MSNNYDKSCEAFCQSKAPDDKLNINGTIVICTPNHPKLGAETSDRQENKDSKSHIQHKRFSKVRTDKLDYFSTMERPNAMASN